MAIVENHQIGNQVIVLDYLQLILSHLFLDDVRLKIRSLRNIFSPLFDFNDRYGSQVTVSTAT